MNNKEAVKLRGQFTWEIKRAGSTLYKDTFHNSFTNEGLNHILNTVVCGSAQIATWYTILSETNTAASTALTYAVPSFTESAAYDETLRPTYQEAPAAAQSTTNAGTVSVFTISATKTMYGAALVGGGTAGSTKSDTAGGGKLLCYALAGTSRAVVDNDVINLTYVITAADDGV